MKDPQIKISVIVPVYNVEPFLEECLDSILNQTLKDMEIICVNDGSTDNSLTILERYAKKDKRVQVISKENGGVSSSRNAGLAVARGEYVSFIDSDDFIEPQMLEMLYAKAKETDADIAITDLYLYDNKTKETSDDFRDQLLYLRLKNKVVTLMEEPELISCIAVWDRIYKRSLIFQPDLRFAEGLVYEDHLFTVQALVRAHRIIVLPEKLYYYRKFGGNSITDRERKNNRYKSDFLEIHTRIMQIIRDEKLPKDVMYSYTRYFMQNAFMHQENAATSGYFKTFFTRVRDVMTEEMYDLVKKYGFPSWIRYAEWLKRGRVSRCRLYFIARNLARWMKKLE